MLYSHQNEKIVKGFMDLDPYTLLGRLELGAYHAGFRLLQVMQCSHHCRGQDVFGILSEGRPDI